MHTIMLHFVIKISVSKETSVLGVLGHRMKQLGIKGKVGAWIIEFLKIRKQVEGEIDIEKQEQVKEYDQFEKFGTY